MGGAHAFHSFMSENIELSAIQGFIDVSILQLADIDGRTVYFHVVVLRKGVSNRHSRFVKGKDGES